MITIYIGYLTRLYVLTHQYYHKELAFPFLQSDYYKTSYYYIFHFVHIGSYASSYCIILLYRHRFLARHVACYSLDYILTDTLPYIIVKQLTALQFLHGLISLHLRLFQYYSYYLILSMVSIH